MEDKEVYPLMMDSKGVILSVPPIINSMNTKVIINTKKCFNRYNRIRLY